MNKPINSTTLALLLTKRAFLVLTLFVTLALSLISSWPDANVARSSAAWQGTGPPLPPTNDDFDSATVINVLPFADAEETSSATAGGDDPTFCTNNGSVWYAFTPTVDTMVEANTMGSSYDSVMSVYTGVRGELTPIPGGCAFGAQSRLIFNATAGTTYYFLIGFCCGSGLNDGGSLVFTVQEVPPPANDNFAQATVAATLPFADNVEITAATLETGEPKPSCVGVNDFRHTVWYAFTATATGSLSASAIGPSPTALAVYTGGSLGSLSEVSCFLFANLATFQATAGTTYYFQSGNLIGGVGPLQFSLDVTPLPIAGFSFNPFDPSTFDTVQYFSNSFDPGNVGFQSDNWRFGDGVTATGCCPTHRYATDGDYTVQLDVATIDGRAASALQSLSVRTHDVAITQFARPKSGRVGQSAKLVIGINNTRYPEPVRVDLYKSDPRSFDGFRPIGFLEQTVPLNTKNQTTDFFFRYTFTNEDATLGQISFKAVATILNSRDALPADNAFTTLPIIVKGEGTLNGAMKGDDDDLVDDVANGDAIPMAAPQSNQGSSYLYIPVVIKQE